MAYGIRSFPFVSIGPYAAALTPLLHFGNAFVHAKSAAFPFRPRVKTRVVQCVELGCALKTIIDTEGIIAVDFVRHPADTLRYDMPLGAVHVAFIALLQKQFFRHTAFLPLSFSCRQKNSRSRLFFMRIYSVQYPICSAADSCVLPLTYSSI